MIDGIKYKVQNLSCSQLVQCSLNAQIGDFVIIPIDSITDDHPQRVKSFKKPGSQSSNTLANHNWSDIRFCENHRAQALNCLRHSIVLGLQRLSSCSKSSPIARWHMCGGMTMHQKHFFKKHTIHVKYFLSTNAITALIAL